MARISKDNYPAILRMVDVEGRKVAEVAAEFGCSSANIYALLKKLRQPSIGTRPAVQDVQPPLVFDGEPPAEPGIPAGFPPGIPEVAAVLPAPVAEEPREVNVLAFARESVPAEPVGKATPSVGFSRPEKRKSEAVGAKLAKPGFGLVMRTADGEENLTPFRSLDDLLSAVKPILRASARSTEPVWFSLQPVDLTTIDIDAA